MTQCEPRGAEALPRVADHRLLHLIGRGSYGEVWLAENTFGRRRAVKVVYRNCFEKPEHFERELAGVRHFEPLSRGHEALVDVLHVGQNPEAGFFHYVMELADDVKSSAPGSQPAAEHADGSRPDASDRPPSPDPACGVTAPPPPEDQPDPPPVPYAPRTLQSELSARGRLPPMECARIGVRLAEALEHLHQHGLVHRDIKPSNVIFVDGVAKLADVGLVSRAGAGSLVGTEGYIAPEGPGRPAADIYSLGKVLYELVTGKDRRDFPDPLTNLGDEAERVALTEFNQIVLKACDPNPAARHLHATELKQELLLLLAGRSVHELRRLQHRLVQLRRIGVVGVLTALVVSAALWMQWRQTEQIRLLADENRRQLIRLNVAAGTREMDSGDPMGSLPWFVEALRLEAGHPEREAMHRYRLEAIRRQCPKLVQMGFHQGAIHHSELSPDGDRLLTAGNDGTALIWDLRTGKRLTPPLEHKGAVLDAAFSPDGDRVATGSDDGAARLWDARTGAALSPPLEHGSNVVRVAFSPDGRVLATASWDGFARLFDLRSAPLSRRLLGHRHRVESLAFSPDGRWLATGATDGEASVWDVAAGGRITAPFPHPKAVGTLAFSPDGQRLLTGCDDGVTRLWRASTGEPVLPPVALGDPGAVWCVAFSPDGRQFLTAGGRFSASGEVRVWDAVTGQPRTPPLIHALPARYACFSPDGRWVASVCGDGAARIWDTASGRVVAPQMRHQMAVWNVAFAEHGRQILTSGRDGSWHLWDLATDAAVEPVIQHTDWVSSVEFSPDGRYLATASRDRTARVWDAETLLPAGAVLPHDERVVFGSFSPDGRRLATGWGSDLFVWDWLTGRLLSRSPPDGQGYGGAFCPDAPVVLSFGSGGAAGVWDPLTWKRLLPPLEHRYECTSIRLSADGRLLVTGAGQRDRLVAKGEIKIWDRKTGRLVAGPFDVGGLVSAVALSPDNRWVVAATSDDSVAPHAAQMWEVSTGRPHGLPLRHNDGIGDVQFSPDGRWLATAGDDGIARVWETATGNPRTSPLKHQRGVSTVRFSPDGRRVLTASMDGTARLWDAETGAPLSPALAHDTPLNRAIFDRTGAAVVTASYDGTVKRWLVPATDLPPGELALWAEVSAGGRLSQTSLVEPLTPAAWSAAWQEWREKRSARFTVSHADIVAWHLRQAQASERTSRWAAGRFHLRRLLTISPELPGLQERLQAVEARMKAAGTE